VVLFLLRPAVPNDDTYASLDWGRDIVFGHVPALESRTFHPFLVAVGAVLSALGSAAPTLVVLLSLTVFVSLAVASGRIVSLLGFPQPAPACAALLILVSPVLPVLAFVAYNDVWFAALVLWGVVFDLEGRPERAWAAFVVAGLTRPEGWGFAIAYGALTWWNRGRPRDRRGWIPIAGLSLAPAIVWLGSEWILFHDPLYSFHELAGTATVTNGGPGIAWRHLRDTVPWAVMLFSGVGVVGVATVSSRRAARTVLTFAGVAPCTVLALFVLGFPLPSRHFATIEAFAVTLAAVGAAIPARQISGWRPRSSRRFALALAGAGVVLVGGASVAQSARSLPFYSKTIEATRQSVLSLSAEVSHSDLANGIPRAGIRTIAMLGTTERPELVWDLGVPFGSTTTSLTRQTRVVVQPSYATWLSLRKLGLTQKTRWKPTSPWHRLLAGAWEIYVTKEPPSRGVG
jgi:hypothetical protein